MANDDGIFVPRRLIFIMIFASLFINIFFLLMGILIGKDDLKWEKEQQGVTAETGITTEPVREETDALLDQDLSVFEGDSEEVRQEPVSTSYLDTPEKQPAPSERVSEQPTTKPAVKPNTAPVKSKGGFWVQLSATGDIGAARKFQREVAGKGYAAVIVTEGAFHKVRVGPYTQRAAADQAKERLNKAFNLQAWVVKK